jgi:hypothetical protein
MHLGCSKGACAELCGYCPFVVEQSLLQSALRCTALNEPRGMVMQQQGWVLDVALWQRGMAMQPQCSDVDKILTREDVQLPVAQRSSQQCVPGGTAAHAQQPLTSLQHPSPQEVGAQLVPQGHGQPTFRQPGIECQSLLVQRCGSLARGRGAKQLRHHAAQLAQQAVRALRADEGSSHTVSSRADDSPYMATCAQQDMRGCSTAT